MKRSMDGWKVAAALLAAAGWCGALLTSTNFRIDRHLLSSGGAGAGLTSANFRLDATLGQIGTGFASSTSFLNDFGYHGQFGGDLIPPSPAIVTAPNGGELVQGGGASGITWTAASDTNLGPNPISIFLSTDGGATFPLLVASGLADSGAYPWSVPASDTATARIRIVATDLAGNSAADASNADFAIDAVDPVVAVTAPNGGDFLTGGGSSILQWTTTEIHASTVAILLSTDGGTSFPTTIASGVADTGSYTWNPVAALDTATARIRVVATDAVGNSGQDDSDADFTIDSTPPTAAASTLTSPNGGEVVAGNSSTAITWNPADFTDANLGATPILLEYSTDGGSTWQLIAANLSNSGSYAWTPPGGTYSNVLLRITATDLSGNTASDVSDADFKILTPPTGVGAVAGDGRIDVSWNIVAGAAGYRVKYGPATGDYSGAGAAEGASPIDAGNFNSLSLTTLPNGTTVFLAVVSYDASGTDSASSIEVTSTPQSSSTFVQTMAQAGGTDTSAYRMIAFPVLPGDPNPLANLTDDLGAYDTTQWRMFLYDNPTQAYVELPDFGSVGIQPGQGFWLITRNNVQINVQGQLASTTQPFTITLGPEWNLVGHPFNFTVNFSACLASGTAIGDPLDNGFLQEDLFAWDGTQYVSATQWAGGQSYWIRNIAGEPVTLTIPAVSAKATVLPAGVSAKGEAPDSGLAPRRFYAAGQLPPAPPGGMKASGGGKSSGGGGGGGGCFLADVGSALPWSSGALLGMLAVFGVCRRSRRKN